ncbi:MAG: hypothetical protein WC269_01470 [Candidatus Gracilibacteria bacterium]|jgi:hypothetical protein
MASILPTKEIVASRTWENNPTIRKAVNIKKLVIVSVVCFLAGVILAIGITVWGSTTITVQNIEYPQGECKVSIEEYVRSLGLYQLALCESGLRADAVGDMNIICPRTGKSVRARGMFQITECYHPEVTDEQAFDPYWSARWTKQMLDAGEGHQWSCKN